MTCQIVSGFRRNQNTMSDIDPSLEKAIRQNVATALAEDIGTGDLTALLVPDQPGSAHVITRVPAVLCGVQWFNACFQALDAHVEINWLYPDGAEVLAGQHVCEIFGKTRAILSAERPALNFLQTLSATATSTRAYVNAVAGTQAIILDTRKTLPGLRLAQKYAVKVAGGQNQRAGLYDGILIKENHIAAAGGIKPALIEAHQVKTKSVQIEVENLEELAEALAANATLILLDNFSLAELRRAVALTNGAAILEASGGISLANVRAVAETGVDRISIGAITKDIQAIDLSLQWGALP